MSWIPSVVLACAVLAGLPAFAQESSPTADIFAPALVAPQFSLEPTTDAFAPVPYAPSDTGTPSAPASAEQHDLVLEARLVEGGAPLGDGIIWRIFAAAPTPDGQLPLLATARGGSTTIPLASGDYLIHAAFGRAGATKRVTVADDDQMESLVLDAGGLKLDAIVGDDEPVPAERLSFEILRENEDGELVTVVPAATPRLVLRLAAGTYHVISRYGGVNAVVRADIEIEPGKLTEAVMRHTGAEVTLKLVSAEGGEALANTSWTVLTQGGTTVHESIGAFPSLVLADGSYTAVATHGEEIYSRDFSVEAGIDRDVEVRLADLVQPEPVGSQPEISGAPMQP
jgi:hypothetical protein